MYLSIYFHYGTPYISHINRNYYYCNNYDNDDNNNNNNNNNNGTQSSLPHSGSSSTGILVISVSDIGEGVSTGEIPGSTLSEKCCGSFKSPSRSMA